MAKTVKLELDEEDAPKYIRNDRAAVLATLFDSKLVDQAKQVQEEYDNGLIPWGAYNDLNNALEAFQTALHVVIGKGRQAAYKED